MTRKQLRAHLGIGASKATMVSGRLNAVSCRLSGQRLIGFRAFRAPSTASRRNRGSNARVRKSTTTVWRASSSTNSSTAPPQVAVLGGGAAGLTAAYFAASAGVRVTIYERTSEAGKKILMSGGARCNVLPVSATAADFVTESTPRLVKAVLASWNVERCRKWLEQDIKLEMGIEHTTNKYFPLSNSSREVRDKLMQACLDAGVEIQYDTSVEGLRPVDGGSSWALRIRNEADVHVPVVILAMGGLSFPAVGTDGTGYTIARRDLNHVLKEPYPALVPLTGEHPGGERLPGLSVDVSLECEQIVQGQKKKKKKNKASREGFLFTHRGFSGPSILDLSHNVVRPLVRKQGGGAASSSTSEGKTDEISVVTDSGETALPSLVVNWSGDTREDWQMRLTAPPGKAMVATRLRDALPQRLADALLAEAGINLDCKVADLRKAERLSLLEILTKYRIVVDGHQGYRKAEVTGGGVSLDEIDTKSMESLKAPGVYMCGEVCDVFGRIGGFNFLWAWTSGRLAGLSAAKRFMDPEEDAM